MIITTIQRSTQTSTIKVLDLCCGYGINAMLLKHHLSIDDLYRYFAVRAIPHTSVKSAIEQIQRDTQFFTRYRRPDLDLQIFGIDIAQNALRYAEATQLVDRGFVINLEQEDVPTQLLQVLGNIDLITVTGGLSYIGTATFRKLLQGCGGHQPWICCFPLRTVNCEPLVQLFQQFGLAIATQGEQIFPQRLFASSDEKQSVIQTLRQHNLSTLPELDGNYLFAKCIIAQPAALPMTLSHDLGLSLMY